MPRLIDYNHVLERMKQEGFVPLYYNAGAFGFAPDATAQVVGWLGSDDPSIRNEARQFTIRVAAPYEQCLSHMLTEAWQSHLPGELWLMPKSHWAYELDFGNTDWLPSALAELSIDAAKLKKLTNAAAIAFATDESDALQNFARTLFTHLHGSDFLAAFPSHKTLATLHHHRQIWWQTTNIEIAQRLRAIAHANQSTQSSSSSPGDAVTGG